MSTTHVSAPESNRNGRGLFQCGTCSQSYSRVDHLARHVRSHTQEKPYRCETCDKQFSRVDLLRRHTSVHSNGPGDSPNKRRRTGSHSSTPLRASKACEACAEQHLKCEDEKPCRRCVRRNIACVVGSRLAVHDSSIVSAPSTLRRESNLNAQDQPLPLSMTNDEPVRQNLATHNSPFGSVLPEMAADQKFPPQHQVHVNGRQMQVESGSLPSADMDYTSSGMFWPTLASDTLTAHGPLGFGGETDLDFSAVDLSFIDTYNTRVPFEFENPGRHVATQEANPVSNNESQEDSETGSNASQTFLHQSIWRFVPAPRDHGYAEQAHLSLPDQEGIINSPESFADFNRRTTAEKLDAPSRDKILAIVLSQVKKHILPALPAFPSVELLDNLIQFFLSGPLHSASTWIHSASFRPKTARSELLLAMAAFGAVLTPDISLRKLGFAIQEVVRNHLPTVFEADNTTIRELEMQQAFMLQLEIGLWSGNSRKMEISESFQQPMLTMLRRRGWFRRSGYPTLTVLAEDEGQVLDKKWRAWVEQESFKRLVYHLIGHDARASISLLVSPLISYAELGLPLPEPQEIWSAGSAREWKTLYRARLEKKSTRIPSLSECVANLDLLDSSKAVIDLKLSCAAFLHAMWGMVWEYRKLTRLFCDRPRVWDSGMTTMSRYQELTKVFDYYRISYRNESTLLLELILMHLHMSLEEIQLFVGLEGPEEARRVHSSVKEWASCKTSRQAVWQAGQLVRAAKALPPLHLRDFYAISLFHASLAFWAYGLASRMFGPDPTAQFTPESMQSSPAPHQTVWLDDEETAATYRYISLDRGTPALHGACPELPPAQLNDPRAIMDVIMETMRRGAGEPLRPNSLLVENLIKIMERLKDTKFVESDVAI